MLDARKGTVGLICAQLLKEQVIEEIPAGRQRNVPLRLNVSRFVGLGVDHDTGKLHFTAINAAGRPILDTSASFPVRLSSSERLDFITKSIKTVLHRDNLKDRVMGIGFCDIGMLDHRTGRSVRAAFLPEWKNMPLQSAIESATSLPTMLLTKTDAICLAEYAINMDLRRETTLFVMVDHGLGMSVLREGELWHGDATVNGEMGHLIVDAAGTICKCGQRGCLETIASSDAIVDKVRANLRPSDAAALGLDNQTLNLEQVIAAAGRGNKLAKLAIREAAEAVGAVAAQVLVILGIEKVIFAGRIAKAGVIFADPFEATIRHLCMDPLNRSVTIVAARATGHPFAQGAAFAALERHFVGHHEGEPRAVCWRLFQEKK